MNQSQVSCYLPVMLMFFFRYRHQSHWWRPVFYFCSKRSSSQRSGGQNQWNYNDKGKNLRLALWGSCEKLSLFKIALKRPCLTRLESYHKIIWTKWKLSFLAWLPNGFIGMCDSEIFKRMISSRSTSSPPFSYSVKMDARKRAWDRENKRDECSSRAFFHAEYEKGVE